MSIPTPETDAASDIDLKKPLVELSRKLEKQRDHLRNAIVKAHDLARAGHIDPMEALNLLQKELYNGGQP